MLAQLTFKSSKPLKEPHALSSSHEKQYKHIQKTSPEILLIEFKVVYFIIPVVFSAVVVKVADLRDGEKVIGG